MSDPITPTSSDTCATQVDVTLPLPELVALSQGRAVPLSPPSPGEAAHGSRQVVTDLTAATSAMLLERGKGHTMPTCLTGLASLCVLRAGLQEDQAAVSNPNNAALVPAAGDSLCRTCREIDEAKVMKVNVAAVERDLQEFRFFDQLERAFGWFLTVVQNNKAARLQRIDQAVRDGYDRVKSQLDYNPRLRASLGEVITLIKRNAELAAETAKDRDKVRAEMTAGQPAAAPTPAPAPTSTVTVSTAPPAPLPLATGTVSAGTPQPPPGLIGRSRRR